MSEREFRRARASMRPFIQLMLAVMCLAMIAGCGGSEEEAGSSTVQGTGFLRPSSENVTIDAGGGLEAMKGEILATKASGATATQINAFFAKMDWDVVGYIPDSETWQIDTKTATKIDLTEAVRKAQESGLFSLVTKNYAWSANALTTNDPLISMNDRPALWDKTAINAASAWGILYSGEITYSDVKIGVIDTTFVEHEDISFEDLDPAGYRAETDHGMHVSGIIAAKGGNSVGTAGIAWSNKGAHLYPVSISRLTIAELVTQAKYMRSKSVRVVNLSWGMNECKPAAECTEDAIATELKSYVQQVKNQLLPLIRSKEGLDIIFVQGAGNAGAQSFTSSSRKLDTSLSGHFAAATATQFLDESDQDWVKWLRNHTLIVGAIAPANNGDAYAIAENSSLPRYDSDHFGRFLVAPGGAWAPASGFDANNIGITSLGATKKYTTMSGTSMAAPHVTGVVGLILQANSYLSSAEAIQIVVDTSTDLSTTRGVFKLVNAEKAVRAALAWGKPTKIVPEEVIAGATQKFSLIGTGLPTDQNFDITFVGCFNIEYLSRTENMHEFSCQMNSTAGSYKAVIRKQGSTEVLASFDVVASKEAPQSQETPWKTVWFTVANNYVPIRLNSDGVVQCASSDGVNCFWTTTAENMPAATQPITCKPEYEALTQHWCAQMKDMLTMQWVERPNTGKAYAVGTCGNWRECESKARVLNATLVAVNDQAEDSWLKSNFSMTTNYWIGATNDGVVGQWRWVTGEPFSYTNWGQNLNNNGGNEFCAHYYNVTPGIWNDVACNSPNIKGLFEKEIPM